MALKRTFEVTQEFTSFNAEKAMAQSFAVGEKITGNYNADKSEIIADGYPIPVEYVKDLGLKNGVLMLAGIGVAFIIIAVLIYQYIKTKKS